MTIGYAPTLLFNHSPLQNLELKNLDLYPTNFSATISDGTLEWSNVNFQSTGTQGSRTWQFRGSGFSGSKSATITYSVETNEKFYYDANAPISGTLTTSQSPYAIALSKSNTNFYYSRNVEYFIIFIAITLESPLGYFDYNLFQADSRCTGCFFELSLCCDNQCCGGLTSLGGYKCCGSTCCKEVQTCSPGGYCC